jgi:hypothetical protein
LQARVPVIEELYQLSTNYPTVWGSLPLQSFAAELLHLQQCEICAILFITKMDVWKEWQTWVVWLIHKLSFATLRTAILYGIQYWIEKRHDRRLSWPLISYYLTLLLEKVRKSPYNPHCYQHNLQDKESVIPQLLVQRIVVTKHQTWNWTCREGTEREQKYSFTLSLTSKLDGVWCSTIRFPPGNDKVPNAWDPGPVWTGAQNLVLARIRFPERPAPNKLLCRLRYPVSAHLTQ